MADIKTKQPDLTGQREARARAIAAAGGIEEALASGALPRRIDATLSEIIVLGLLRQQVRVFFTVFGHGSTEVGEVLRVYQRAGLVRVCGIRSEIEGSHAAAAMRWVTGERAAVVTSIGPGALQALAASIAPASDGIGVWYLFGDETTEDEGPNMQQIPKHEQHPFLRLCAAMGEAYVLHTPLAVSTALRRGMTAVNHPHRAGPFYLLMPMNTQPARLAGFNLDELPDGRVPRMGAAADDGAYEQAADLLLSARRVVVKVGGGSRGAGPELLQLLDLVDGVVVTNPIVSGVVPYAHFRNMSVGGSKGSLCGNYAMENADLLVAVGMRFVCQSDCSRTGFPNVEHVVNINTDEAAATHYNRTIALLGDAAPTLRHLNAVLKQRGGKIGATPSPWLVDCTRQRQAWQDFKAARFNSPTLYDEAWGGEVLTQPAAIKIATDWARARDAVCFFDAGDVQANGFQIVEDDRLGRTFTETGASYMGFAASALLATAAAERPFYAVAFSGDGSFTMSPQVLIDGVQHGARGCILLLDNRRMGAISGLQQAQYGTDFATSDAVRVDYLAWAGAIKGVQAIDGGRSPDALVAALDRAGSYDGLSLVHVPVYYGPNELGGMGVFGRWNVGNWCEEAQALRHEIGL
ncbi:MAG: thiamine pyrophosphate-dependent enzyme [Actinobacteria bacterium]|nr:thiamine pyrophosphate-dependent enzyme [Actinomycetota bacterium]MCL5026470.1 thiamine pyrophosphate-dependent enzyme [Chloroflexota bacterium]